MLGACVKVFNLKSYIDKFIELTKVVDTF